MHKIGHVWDDGLYPFIDMVGVMHIRDMKK
jgi:hypothetical protein